MSIGSIHHKSATGLVGQNRGATPKSAGPGQPIQKISTDRQAVQKSQAKSEDPLSTFHRSHETQASQQQLEPIDRIPATRNNLDARREPDLEYRLQLQASEGSGPGQSASGSASAGERAVAFYMITETISAAVSQGELIGIDTYA